MKPHKIVTPLGFCKSDLSRRASMQLPKEPQGDAQKLRRQLKQTEQELFACKRQLEELRQSTQAKHCSEIEALNTTIRLLREELQFRAAEDKQVQKHIQNYQMMNQRLRQQVQKLQESLRNHLDVTNEIPSSSVLHTTVSSTPSSHTQRGRSPLQANYCEKENHVLTPKSKLAHVPRELEMEYMFREMPRPQKYFKSKIHIN